MYNTRNADTRQQARAPTCATGNPWKQRWFCTRCLSRPHASRVPVARGAGGTWRMLAHRMDCYRGTVRELARPALVRRSMLVRTHSSHSTNLQRCRTAHVQTAACSPRELPRARVTSAHADYCTTCVLWFPPGPASSARDKRRVSAPEWPGRALWHGEDAQEGLLSRRRRRRGPCHVRGSGRVGGPRSGEGGGAASRRRGGWLRRRGWRGRLSVLRHPWGRELQADEGCLVGGSAALCAPRLMRLAGALLIECS